MTSFRYASLFIQIFYLSVTKAPELRDNKKLLMVHKILDFKILCGEPALIHLLETRILSLWFGSISEFYFVACSTNKLTKIRQCKSHMEQCRKLSSFWVRVRTKNPTAKKPQQLGIKAGAGMEGRGMTGHSHRETAAWAHGKAHNGTENTMGFFACLCYSRSIYANCLHPGIFTYYFPMSKGFWVTLSSKYSQGFTLRGTVRVAQWNHVLPEYCDKCKSNFT